MLLLDFHNSRRGNVLQNKTDLRISNVYLGLTWSFSWTWSLKLVIFRFKPVLSGRLEVIFLELHTNSKMDAAGRIFCWMVINTLIYKSNSFSVTKATGLYLDKKSGENCLERAVHDSILLICLTREVTHHVS